MLKYEYAWEKLYIAIRCLAGKGTMKERLVKAWRYGIGKLVDPPLGNKLSAELLAIHKALTSKANPENGKSSVAATVGQMTEEEACTWSMKIVDLAIDVTRLNTD